MEVDFRFRMTEQETVSLCNACVATTDLSCKSTRNEYTMDLVNIAGNMLRKNGPVLVDAIFSAILNSKEATDTDKHSEQAEETEENKEEDTSTEEKPEEGK